MRLIIALSIRQLVLQRRYLIVLLLAAAPVAVAIASRSFDSGSGGPPLEDVLDQLIVSIVLPITVLIAGTVAFGHELEDRTITYLVLKPLPRWSIVAAKLVSVVVATAPPLMIGSIAAVLIMEPSEVMASLGISLAILAGVALYGALFLLLGLVTQHALPIGLIYVVLWEAAVAQFLAGARYLSIRQYTLTLAETLTPDRLVRLTSEVIELPAAITGTIALVAVFFLITVRRLRGMDFP